MDCHRGVIPVMINTKTQITHHYIGIYILFVRKGSAWHKTRQCPPQKDKQRKSTVMDPGSQTLDIYCLVWYYTSPNKGSIKSSLILKSVLCYELVSYLGTSLRSMLKLLIEIIWMCCQVSSSLSKCLVKLWLRSRRETCIRCKEKVYVLCTREFPWMLALALK